MAYKDWKEKIDKFEVIDVRGRNLDFLIQIKEKASTLKNGEGLHIIQSFDPLPLYTVMTLMGYEHQTEKTSDREYHVWFCRVKKGD